MVWVIAGLFTLPETNSSPMKIDGWEITFLLGWPIFRGDVSFRECTYMKGGKWPHEQREMDGCR